MQKDIKGFENYQITDDGKVWSKKSKKYLSPQTNNKYLYVPLSLNGVKYNKNIHRLVAEAFIENKDNKPEVDHIIPLSDGGTNNVSNLRWCTSKENKNNFFTKSKYKLSNKGKLTKNLLDKISKKVYQYTLDWKLVRVWNSTRECDKNGYCYAAVSSCCRNKYLKNKNIYKGYIWSYEGLKQH